MDPWKCSRVSVINALCKVPWKNAVADGCTESAVPHIHTATGTLTCMTPPAVDGGAPFSALNRDHGRHSYSNGLYAPSSPISATQHLHPLGDLRFSLLPVLHLDVHGLSRMQPGYRFPKSCFWDDGADLPGVRKLRHAPHCRNFSDFIYSRIPYRQIN